MLTNQTSNSLISQGGKILASNRRAETHEIFILRDLPLQITCLTVLQFACLALLIGGANKFIRAVKILIKIDGGPNQAHASGGEALQLTATKAAPIPAPARWRYEGGDAV